jgi:hypothetical protein
MLLRPQPEARTNASVSAMAERTSVLRCPDRVKIADSAVAIVAGERRETGLMCSGTASQMPGDRRFEILADHVQPLIR